jgi:cobalt-zinc-cadmium resistance protein CzcA
MLVGPIMLLIVVPTLRMMFLEPEHEPKAPGGAGQPVPAE